MTEALKKFLREAEQKIRAVVSEEELEKLKSELLGRKSFLAEIAAGMKSLPAESRAEVGRLLNEAKHTLTALIEGKKSGNTGAVKKDAVDITLSLPGQLPGSIHPISSMIARICGVFKELRFSIYEGNEVEDECHNFEALNIPKDHPSRDDFDTFFLNVKEGSGGKFLLRSHTSPSQIRLMQKSSPPFAYLVPGKVYRPDAVDASHSYVFHQIEGFAVDKTINFSHLKGVLYHFARKVFGDDVRLRFRPHFFPFTEPSAEVDVSCFICGGKGCSVCSRKGWLEILGCGMIHPNVLNYSGIDPGEFQGFAFGMGVERITMLKLGIDDIRLFFENDIRFLRQLYEIQL